MININIPDFIAKSITGRESSLFLNDIDANKEALWDKIKNKSILVIGGAGTIGSSFIKSILAFEPARLAVVDINENGLTELTRDLRSDAHIKLPEYYKTYPINFGDLVFEKLLTKEGPFHIVANFAAHKHVRSEKDEYSILAMLQNNVFLAGDFLERLLDYKPEHFFCVSTDKATNPVNVMGASKKLMEEVIMAYSHRLPVTTARFANVAFSNGSLLDGYLYRMMKRQPLSCPSDVKRFFVSPEESGQICMLACLLGKSGDIFFPKLGEEQMIYFRNITQSFIRTAGFEPYICQSEEEARNFDINLSDGKYPVYYFKTNTSGEKLFEEFYTINDIIDDSSFNKLSIIKQSSTKSLEEITEILDQLRSLINSQKLSKNAIIDLLSGYLPDFQHIETGKNLDQKM
jgi:FlaA1/EpsC-like NDP-sugar epimerase